MEPQNTWDRLLGRIEGKVSRHSFRTWFKPTQFMDEDASRVRVSVPNDWFAEWLRTHYLGVIREAMREADLPELSVDFRPETTGLPQQAPPAALLEAPAGAMPMRAMRKTALRSPRRTEEAAAPAETQPPRDAWLNGRYTFDTFVVSSCNQFAHAAARAVAEQPKRLQKGQPSRTYNPLYIYGGVGLGKTHLMQAIGNQFATDAGTRMCYISSEHVHERADQRDPLREDASSSRPVTATWISC